MAKFERKMVGKAASLPEPSAGIPRRLPFEFLSGRRDGLAGLGKRSMVIDSMGLWKACFDVGRS
jgi:hypothetical protein